MGVVLLNALVSPTSQVPVQDLAYATLARLLNVGGYRTKLLRELVA